MKIVFCYIDNDIFFPWRYDDSLREILVRSCKHDFPHQVKSDESKSVTPETEEVREDKAKQCTISTKMS